MNNILLQSKLELRVNKIASLDYGNIEPWQKAEAINKAQMEWVRRQLEGINQEKTGNEGSTRRIDDLQQLLTTWTGLFTAQNDNLFWQSESWPSNYIEWCRIDAQAQDSCKTCPPRSLSIYEGNEADVSLYLKDFNRRPSYAYANTFSTVMTNTFKIWSNKQFDIVNPLVTFYRVPNTIVFLGTYDPYTNTTSTVDIPCEFPDNITEIIIDEAAAILAMDIDDNTKTQQLSQRGEHNT